MLTAIAFVHQRLQPPVYYGSLIEPPKAMPEFTLESVNGPVSSESFRGKYVLLYFGYTSCPDICPVTLANLKAALSRLDAREAGRFQVVFVSVDYKRDPPEASAAFARKFDSGFVGLSGTQAQIDQATKEYGIYYKLNAPDPGTGFYSVDHTATVLVLDPNGALILTWPFGMQPDQVASDLVALVSR
jgi:protein SCO1/2